MTRITRITVGTLATAALLIGGGGIALAAQPDSTAITAITATGTGTGTTGATVTGTTGIIGRAPAAPVTASAGISSREAVQIARKRVPGARVSKVEREWEHGRRAWKVELHKGAWEYDVYVSARTGKIIKLKRDHDD